MTARNTSLYGTTVAEWARHIGRMKLLVTPEKDRLKYISDRSIEAEIRGMLTEEDKKIIRKIKEEAKQKKESLCKKKGTRRKAQKPNCMN